jgi:hypothetical protein
MNSPSVPPILTLLPFLPCPMTVPAGLFTLLASKLAPPASLLGVTIRILLLSLLLLVGLATSTCAGDTTTSSSPLPSSSPFFTTSGKSTTLTTEPAASHSSFVFSPERSFIRLALKETVSVSSPVSSYSGWRGGSIMYSALWVRISTARSTASRRTLRS